MQLGPCTDYYLCVFFLARFDVLINAPGKQESGGSRAFFKKLRLEVARKPLEVVKLMVPALLYTVQNNLLYIALQHLDPATYSVCYQTKILTTALFSVVLLGKRLSILKWSSLVLLMAGVALAELSNNHTSETKIADVQVSMMGFWCVVAAACTSGFAGVYFEMLLKGSKTSLWIRNIQMGLPSIVLAFAGVFLNDWESVRSNGFFYGYNGAVMGVVLLQAGGGLVVAVVVKYTDNIRKSFAAAVSIVMSCIMSMFLFDFKPNVLFVIGSSFVCTSVFMYSRPSQTRGLPMFHKTAAP